MIELRHIFSYWVLIVTVIAGSASLLLFGFFLFGYSFTIINFGYGWPSVLVWDMLLCLMFFVQHSTMIRKGFRSRLAAIVSVHFHGALYTVASGAVLFVIILFWQDSGVMLISLQGVSRWLARGVFFLSLIGMIWGLRVLKTYDAFGIKPIQNSIRATHEQGMPLIVQGPYRWVRHPLYFSILMLIWSCPDVSVDRLLFNVLFTAWIVLGTLLEERDLVAEYGETYLGYQRKVSMLIPWNLHKCLKSNGL